MKSLHAPDRAAPPRLIGSARVERRTFARPRRGVIEHMHPHGAGRRDGRRSPPRRKHRRTSASSFNRAPRCSIPPVQSFPIQGRFRHQEAHVVNPYFAQTRSSHWTPAHPATARTDGGQLRGSRDEVVEHHLDESRSGRTGQDNSSKTHRDSVQRYADHGHGATTPGQIPSRNLHRAQLMNHQTNDCLT